MSTMDAAFDLPQTGSLPARAPMREVRAELGPWGVWGALGWGIFAVTTGLFAAVIYTVIWMLANELRFAAPQDVSYATAVGIVASVTPIAVIVIAVKLRSFSLRDYFALNAFPRHDLVLGVAGLTVLIVAFGAIGSLLGIDGGTKSMEATYRAARLAGVLPLLWLATVVIAPVTEEILFRGFLHLSWAPSWLGVSGTIALTSTLWAALHQQYNAIGILFIFLMGLIFGWIRHRSGSTTLTIVLHMLNNVVAMILVCIHVELLS